jgi:hypothetical protein
VCDMLGRCDAGSRLKGRKPGSVSLSFLPDIGI